MAILHGVDSTALLRTLPANSKNKFSKKFEKIIKFLLTFMDGYYIIHLALRE